VRPFKDSPESLVTSRTACEHPRTMTPSIRSLSLWLSVAVGLLALDARAAPTFIPAAGAVDAVYDVSRGVVYVSSTSGQVLRYDVATHSFTAPYAVGGVPLGMALSPDGNTLVVANDTLQGSLEGSHQTHVDVIDLRTDSIHPITFTGDFYESGT